MSALRIACLLGLVVLMFAGASPRSALATGDVALDGIRVTGTGLVNLDGRPIRLVGVNRSGTEFACIHDWGIFEGPTDVASAELIRSWHVNAVRIGLNEDCWLGINGVQPVNGGAKYRQAVIDYVNTLTWSGLYAIVDLHWSAPGSVAATSLRPMPDADHSLEFWHSVASTLADNPNVIFDVYNEPFGVDWDCWRDGCQYSGGPDGGPWQTVGMQSLIDSIRDTGARQPILVSGLWFANDVTGWLAHKPEDPLNQLIASVHVYPFNRCNAASCWDDEIAPLTETVPVLLTEFGTDWTPPHDDAMAIDLMNWADEHGIGYLAWTWNNWGEDGNSLLANDKGEPTRWGADIKAHLLRISTPE